MGTLPTLTRTWRFQVNQATAAGANMAASCQNLLWAIKESLKGNGAWTDSAGAGAASAGNWTVRSSSDGVGGFGNGDSIDRWVAATNLIWANPGTNHSWIVLRQTGIGATFEVLIDCVPNAAQNQAYISMSVVGFSLNGTATNRPTAIDECQFLATAGAPWGGISSGAGAASTLHVLKSTDGKSTRVLICRNGFVPGYWDFELLNEAPTAWTGGVPAFGIVLGDSTVAPVSSLPVIASGTNGYVRPESQNGQTQVTLEYSRQFGLLSAQTVANDIGASWWIGDMGVYSETPYSKGRLGKILDQWWTAPTLVDSDTFPAAGTRNFCLFGDMVQPWNTVAPTFGGGVSTARDGEHAGYSFYSSTFVPAVMASPAGSPSAPSIYVTTTINYRMQATDSVTFALYEWSSVGAPDFAGVGYPGPNTPTKIAISSFK